MPRHLRVVTNGTALTPRRIERLCEAGLTSISISIDSLDPERFARSRGGASLALVLRNLASLAAYREREGRSYLRVKIKAVLVDDPYESADEILRYSAALGLDMPHFSRLDGRGAARDLYTEPWLVDDWAETGGAEFNAWYVRRWQELTTPPSSPHESGERSRPALGYVHPSLRPSPDVCRWAVDAAFISSSASSLSCCEQMIDVPRLEWGSLEHEPLEVLWNGPMFWGYRLPLSLGLVPERCVGCSWAPHNGIPLTTVRSRSGRTMLPA
jgi:hypothetical protein